MARVARGVKDKRLLGLLRRYLQSGMMEGSLSCPGGRGRRKGARFGPWWNAGASHMNQAVPNSVLRRLGLPSFLDEHRRITSLP